MLIVFFTMMRYFYNGYG